MKKSVMAVALIACASLASTMFAQADKTQEKVNLMVTAIQARDSGDLQASKTALEELSKLAPEDKGVQQLLISVNADIERQARGQTPLYVSDTAVLNTPAPAPEAAPEAAPAAEGEAVAEGEVAVEEANTVDQSMEDALRKQKLQILAAYDLIDKAYDEMDSSKWDDANQSLADAEAKLPATELADEARGEVKKARAAMAKERAYISIDEKKPNEAKAFAADYASNEDSVKKGQKLVAEIDDAAGNPYNNSLKDVSPEYVARQARIETLLKEGATQYLYGDYQGARVTFSEIETLDADNIKAKAYQKLISEKLANSGKLTYEATRGQMLDEVLRSWQRPKVYDRSAGPTRAGVQESPVDLKLKTIVIPEISFPDPGVPLSHAINTLSILSAEYDKSESADGKKGVNMMLLEADGAKNVVLTLRDLTLAQVLAFVTRQAGYQYDVEDGVVVVRKGEVIGLETRVYPITPMSITTMTGISAGGGSDSSDPFGGGGGGGGGDSSPESVADGIKKFLERSGVEFGAGSNVASDGSAQLIVTNTSRMLEKVQVILSRFSETKQVEIEAKFMEVNQGALKEIGFNWSMSKNGKVLFNTGNRTLAQAQSGTNKANQMNIVTGKTLYETTITGTGSSQVIVSKDLGTELIRADVPDIINPQLPSTINTALDANLFTNAASTVMDGYTFTSMIQALEQTQGSDMLSAPKVTVHSQVEATITVSQQMRYPDSWGDVQSNVGTSSINGGSAGVTITPGTPQDFRDYDVGVVMRVTPTVTEDGAITLDLNPKVTEFEGFMEYGGYAVAIAGDTTVTVPSGFIQPVFSVREIKTMVTVFDGATLVMGGLTREQVLTVNDQVPILGNMPLIGRLFQSKGESRQKKNLLIFVTANIVSPGGSTQREFTNERVRAGSTFQNPIIVSPSGALHRVAEVSAADAN